MIRRVDQSTKDRFLLLAGRSDCAGLRLETAFACYEAHPAAASFYLAGEEGALMLAADSLLCCGVLPADELAAFAAFFGVRQMEGCGPAPGFSARPVLVMRRKAHTPPPSRPLAAPAKVTLTPDLWRLRQANLLAADPDAWYADACLRCRRGAVIAAVEGENGYLSTAGVYAVRPQSAYLTGVATSPAARGQGFAQAAVAALCERFAEKELLLRCAEELRGFYEQLGFCLLRRETDWEQTPAQGTP